MARTTRNSTGRRLQREQNEQSTSTRSSTTKNQAIANLTGTKRRKTKILTGQAIGTVEVDSSSTKQIPRQKRKLKNTSLEQPVGIEAETLKQVATGFEAMGVDTHAGSKEQPQQPQQPQQSQPVVSSIPKRGQKSIKDDPINVAITTSKRVLKRKAVTESSTTADQMASDDPKADAEEKPHKRGSLLKQKSIVPDTITTEAATNRSVKKRKTNGNNEEEGNGKSEKDKSPEKRLARFRTRCTPGISERIYRAETQRLYMVSRKMVEECLQEFAILGSTGNIYTVTITHKPNCTCPDFMKGNLCKHILFIYLKVLRLKRNSPFIYQKALLTEEIHSIFANAAPDPTILANQYVRDKYETITSGEASEPTSNDEKRRPIEGDCPICYEPLEEKDRKNIVWCKGGCGNNLHNDCFEQWKKSKHGGKVTCVYCRGNWVEDEKVLLNEGYLNLGSAQGMSTERDTSSYYRNYRTSRNSWY